MLSVILFFLLGLSVGSFLNVLIYRIPRNEPFIKGRSFCDNCKKKLLWYDLIPLFSFIVLKGKCRFCRKKISSQLPIVELVTGFLFALCILKFPLITDINLYLNLFIISSLIVIFFTDLNYEIILDKILLPLFAVGFVSAINSGFLNHLVTAILSFLAFLLIFTVSKGKAFGFGDVKYAGVLGLIMGFPLSLFSFYVTFLTGGITSLILVLWGKKKLKGDTIAFGPFLSLGAIFSIFLGNPLVLLLSSFLLS